MTQPHGKPRAGWTALCARSAGSVWIGFSGGDVPRADEIPVCWGKEKEVKAYGDAAQSDEATRVGEVG